MGYGIVLAVATILAQQPGGGVRFEKAKAQESRGRGEGRGAGRAARSSRKRVGC